MVRTISVRLGRVKLLTWESKLRHGSGAWKVILATCALVESRTSNKGSQLLPTPAKTSQETLFRFKPSLTKAHISSDDLAAWSGNISQ